MSDEKKITIVPRTIHQKLVEDGDWRSSTNLRTTALGTIFAITSYHSTTGAVAITTG